MKAFTEKDIDRIGWFATEIKMVLMVAGLVTSGPDAIAAFRLLARISEMVHAMSEEEKKQSMIDAILGKDSMDLKAELRFILTEMERDELYPLDPRD